jgi:hypothetical protein
MAASETAFQEATSCYETKSLLNEDTQREPASFGDLSNEVVANIAEHLVKPMSSEDKYWEIAPKYTDLRNLSLVSDKCRGAGQHALFRHCDLSGKTSKTYLLMRTLLTSPRLAPKVQSLVIQASCVDWLTEKPVSDAVRLLMSDHIENTDSPIPPGLRKYWNDELDLRNVMFWHLTIITLLPSLRELHITVGSIIRPITPLVEGLRMLSKRRQLGKLSTLSFSGGLKQFDMSSLSTQLLITSLKRLKFNLRDYHPRNFSLVPEQTAGDFSLVPEPTAGEKCLVDTICIQDKRGGNGWGQEVCLQNFKAIRSLEMQLSWSPNHRFWAQLPCVGTTLEHLRISYRSKSGMTPVKIEPKNLHLLCKLKKLEIEGMFLIEPPPTSVDQKAWIMANLLPPCLEELSLTPDRVKLDMFLKPKFEGKIRKITDQTSEFLAELPNRLQEGIIRGYPLLDFLEDAVQQRPSLRSITIPSCFWAFEEYETLQNRLSERGIRLLHPSPQEELEEMGPNKTLFLDYATGTIKPSDLCEEVPRPRPQLLLLPA